MWKNCKRLQPTDRCLKAMQGSVMVEFLIVFPLFLLLAMFTIEISLTWVDRHVMKLAAYEAARIYVAAPAADWSTGSPETNPCLSPSTSAKAKQAAIRKMAIITPPIAYFGKRLAPNSTFNFNPSIPGMNLLPSTVQRIINRWPTAVLSTSVACTFDANTQTVTVDVTYARAPQTPFVGPVIWAGYILSKVNPVSGKPIATLNNVFSEVTSSDTLAAFQPLKNEVVQSLAAASHVGMDIMQTADLLKNIPGIDDLLGNIPSLPTQLVTDTKNEISTISNKISNLLESQTNVLTALLLGTPEALRRIPMKVTVEVGRIFSDRAELVKNQDGTIKIREPRWEGRIKGIIVLEDDYRTWAQHMSENQDGIISGGESL